MTGAECLFCRIVRREITAVVVYEDEQSLVFKDISPKAPTHLLLIPKRHVDSLSATVDEDGQWLGSLQRLACKVARSQGLSSFRLVTNNGADAGQSVPHLHYHLLAGRAMGWPPG